MTGGTEGVRSQRTETAVGRYFSVQARHHEITGRVGGDFCVPERMCILFTCGHKRENVTIYVCSDTRPTKNLNKWSFSKKLDGIWIILISPFLYYLLVLSANIKQAQIT